jgi:hypothetical protein
MTEYDNRNSFVLFNKTRKREGKKDPDLQGTYTDDRGREFWVSAWVNKTREGDKFISGKIGDEKESQSSGRRDDRGSERRDDRRDDRGRDDRRDNRSGDSFGSRPQQSDRRDDLDDVIPF